MQLHNDVTVDPRAEYRVPRSHFCGRDFEGTGRDFVHVLVWDLLMNVIGFLCIRYVFKAKFFDAAASILTCPLADFKYQFSLYAYLRHISHSLPLTATLICNFQRTTYTAPNYSAPQLSHGIGAVSSMISRVYQAV